MGDMFNCNTIYIYHNVPPGFGPTHGSTDGGQRERDSAPLDCQPPPRTPLTSTPRTPRKYKKRRLTEADGSGEQNPKKQKSTVKPSADVENEDDDEEDEDEEDDVRSVPTLTCLVMK
ncbi:uncharacterized protein LOC136037866 [Artemia franciscana]|uniref:uncharacterized protein LOC136037866 n=1 Tax=Artemia franciscana TaxID=6661 RepID=UPI0032DB4D64